MTGRPSHIIAFHPHIIAIFVRIVSHNVVEISSFLHDALMPEPSLPRLRRLRRVDDRLVAAERVVVGLGVLSHHGHSGSRLYGRKIGIRGMLIKSVFDPPGLLVVLRRLIIA